jgi:hypothetical protein
MKSADFEKRLGAPCIQHNVAAFVSQFSHYGTAPSPHPHPCSPVLLRVSLSSSIWITLDQLCLHILGHLGTPPLSLIGPSPLILAQSSRTTPDHLLSLIPDFLRSLIMTSLDPLDVILWYCHHHCHLCVIPCLVSFELYLLVASPECFQLYYIYLLSVVSRFSSLIDGIPS